MNFAERYGPWAVIAGASEGTGRCFAQELAKHGVNCILLARREAPLLALADELRKQYGIECVTACVDLAAADAAEKIIASVGQRDVGLYINNAGSDPNGRRFLDNDLDNWVQLVNRNVMTTMRICHHFGRVMREKKRGGIILVGSGACYGSASTLTVYSGTKAFDLCFGEGLWAELQPHGVHVLNLILNRTDTPAFRELMDKLKQPMPSDLADPAEVARVGLERLPHGPVHNWDVPDAERGFATSSAAERRARVQMIESVTNKLFGKK